MGYGGTILIIPRSPHGDIAKNYETDSFVWKPMRAVHATDFGVGNGKYAVYRIGPYGSYDERNLAQ
jgi:hypothetical protein